MRCLEVLDLRCGGGAMVCRRLVVVAIVSDNVTQELVFETDHQEMWQKALKIMGGRFSVYSNYPSDPRDN